jgi:hypothetical protein
MATFQEYAQQFARGLRVTPGASVGGCSRGFKP